MARTQFKLIFAAVVVVGALFLLAPAAEAKVVAFVSRDSAGVLYEYSYDELLRSYSKKSLGGAAPLFDDYKKKDMALLLDDVNGYVDYEVSLAAYAKAVFRGDSFNLDAYTSGSEAKLAQVDRVKVVTYADNKLVYTDKVLSNPIDAALAEVNAAVDPAALRLVLENRALVLGLDISVYNSLSNSGKNTVAEGVLLYMGSGYPEVETLIQVFTAEIERVKYTADGVLAALNGAYSLEEFSSLLLANGEIFELELDAFALIISSRSGQVLDQVYWSSPYGSAAALRDTFNQAVAETLRSYVVVSHTYCDYTVQDMLDYQMPLKPQWQSGGRWVNAPRDEVQRYVDPANFLLPGLASYVREIIVGSEALFVRESPTTASASIATVQKGEIYPVLEAGESEDGTAPGSEGYWFRISLGWETGWVCGRYTDWVAEAYAPEMLQFLVLSGSSGVTVSDLGFILRGKGILDGTEGVFYQASRSNNINEIFLTSLALHESGNGTSQLANGVLYTPADPSLPARVVYNMYGIGAVDSNPILKGAEYAYSQGWFTPEEAIIGGAYFVSRNYVNNSNYYQDTLYKMRWNPGAPGKHQYATDIGWASKQTRFIQQFYDRVNMYHLRFDIPLYIREPETGGEE